MFTTVTRQLKRALGAAKSVLAIAGTAAAVLDPRLSSYLAEGEQLDGMEKVQLTLVRWIEDDHRRLEEKESRQRKALRQLKQLRLGRDRLQGNLYGMLLRLRKTFDDAHGQGLAEVYLDLGPGLDDLEPLAFRRQARETVGILTDPHFAPPTPAVEGLWENPVQYADQIRDVLEPFEASLDEIESQKKEVEKAQRAKTDALEEVAERLKWSIRLFESIYHLAGLGFHAERLRVTLPSPRSSSEQENDASSAGKGTEGEDAESSETPESDEAPESPEAQASDS